MKTTLQAGMEFTHRYRVAEQKTVPHVYEESELFQKMPAVFATAFMVGLMEWACMEALREHLEEDEISLGTHINVSHTAATPPGMEVEVQVHCLEVAGPKTRWAVTARDERDLIGEGIHERHVIAAGKFEAILARKRSAQRT